MKEIQHNNSLMIPKYLQTVFHYLRLTTIECAINTKHTKNKNRRLDSLCALYGVFMHKNTKTMYANRNNPHIIR